MAYIFDLIPRGLQREGHIRAGIAIRDGENVQSVDHLLVRAEPGQPCVHEPFHCQAIDWFAAKFLNASRINCHESLFS
jgi:hypothetical protein